jgi:molybdopterin-guanine dinucleotide biosynthesis protein A
LRTLGVLLAGGRGTRLGLEGPKALVVARGRTLLEHARAALAPVCDEVVIVAPRSMDLPVAASERVGDAVDGAGPLSALVAGLEARAFERALALAVDLPLLTSDALARLLALHRDDVATVPRIGGELQPLAAVYAPAAAAALRAALAAGQRALVPTVRGLGPRLLDDRELAAAGLAPAAFADVDTRADLDALAPGEGW